MTRSLPCPIIVGYTVKAADGAEKVLDMPQPPSNYGAEKAEEWRQTKGLDARKKALFEAAYSKVTGHIQSVFAVDPVRGEIFNSKAIPVGKPAVHFMRWLLSAYPTAFRRYPNRLGLDQNAVALYGFDIKQFVRVCGIEAILNEQKVPIGFWYQNEDVFNPYDMVVESDRRKLLSLNGLLSSVGISVPEHYRPHDNAQLDARFTAELVHCFELVAAEDDSKLYGIVTDNMTPIAEIVDDDDSIVEEEVEEEVEEDDEEYEEGDEYEEVEEEVEEDDEEYEYVEEGEEEPAPPRKTKRRPGRAGA